MKVSATCENGLKPLLREFLEVEKFPRTGLNVVISVSSYLLSHFNN
jgi:hypothetical protein